MSHVFKPGDRVEIIRGVKTGGRLPTFVTEVTSELFPFPSSNFPEVPLGTPVHMLAVRELGTGHQICSPPSWLAPFLDGSEPVEWTEELRKLCRVKETA